MDNNEGLHIKEEIAKYLVHWKWFVLCISITLSLAYLQLRSTIPLYTASTQILITENQKSGISKELVAFQDLGIVGGSSNNPDNEIIVLKSRRIIGNVIDSLKFDVSYFREEKFHTLEIYKTSPVIFSYDKNNQSTVLRGVKIIVSLENNNSFKIKDANGILVVKGKLNELVKCKLGTFTIIKNPDLGNKEIIPQELIISVTPRNLIINKYLGKINISPVGKNSSVINLSLTDISTEKASDFLNELVRQYNLDANNDKNQVSRKTESFITNRLKTVGNELAILQDSIKDFKTSTGFIGLSSDGGALLENLAANNTELKTLETQIRFSNWIKNSINNQSSKEELLPTNLGFENSSITAAIDNYNQLILSRERLQSNAGEKNPQLIALQEQIINIKLNLKENLKIHSNYLQVKFEQLTNEKKEINSKQATIPIIEREFIDIARQQEIISSLYSYLLTKKEETSISLAISVANAKVIDMAYGSNFPVNLNGKMVYLGGLLLGLLLPFGVIFIKELSNTKIISRKDIEALASIPFLGDIPSSDIKDKLVVKNNDRSSTSEAFRFIRANIDFILPDTKKTGKTIFVSSTSANEGKSFVSINLASALALSGKKVLLLGMDFRAPKVTKYLGIQHQKGITHFIKDSNLTSKDIVFKLPEIDQLDIISSGEIPPNPSELVVNARMKDFFVEVKQNYDFIIVDTAPVNIVSDTLLLSKYADMFIYVIRANYTDKRSLVVPEELHKTKKLSKMAIVLNDVDIKTGYGYGGYGGYDYRGGYGYYTDWKKKSWYSRILGRKKKKIG